MQDYDKEKPFNLPTRAGAALKQNNTKRNIST